MINPLIALIVRFLKKSCGHETLFGDLLLGQLPITFTVMCDWQVADESHHKVTMIPGDGVGPELMSSVKAVFSAAAVPVDFEEVIAR